MLCLPGPENPYRYDGDFKISGVPIYIKQEGGQVRLWRSLINSCIVLNAL